MRRSAAACLLFILLANALMVSGDGEADGAGSGALGRATSRATALIHDVYELQNMSHDLNGSYEIAWDIDASATKNWNGGAGFAPVGNKTLLFNGTFDGKGHIITGLFINRPTTDFTGLFGHTGKNNSVKNIGVVNFTVTGYDCVGGLVGSNEYGIVNNSYSTGNVFGQVEVGGLVGCNYYGTVKNSHATGNVTGNVISGSVGGLAGTNTGTVSNSFFTGYVSGNSHVGGIVGQSSGVVDHCNVTGDVTGIRSVGGLVGSNAPWYSSGCALDHSYSTGNVTGDYDVGGLVGYMGAIFDNRGWVNNSYATGNTTGNHSVGGLVGYSFGAVNNSYANGNVTGTDDDVGGLVGINFAGVVNSHATGNVSGRMNVGGLVGCNNNSGNKNPSTVNSSYATGNVTGNNSVGGLVGQNIGAVNNSSASGNVSGLSYGVGGLVGFDYGTVSNSCACGKVNGEDYVGGLVGYGGGAVDNSSATGDVTGHEYTGGLVGFLSRYYRTWVNNSYATGKVNGGYGGGLVGYNGGAVSNSYASGNVRGDRGGLVGSNWGMVSNCFWDKEASGVSSSSGGTGKSTAQMKTRSTFTDAGWDFQKVWWMIENETYPLLKWQDIKPPIANAGRDRTIDEDTPTTFNGSESRGDLRITNYTWTFMDRAPITLYGIQRSYIFDDPGIFIVTLKVTDTAGHWGTDTMIVKVVDITAPIADAGADRKVDLGTIIEFDCSRSSDNVMIVNYTWTFSDGALVALYGARPAYRFDYPGIFRVTLSVRDAAGNRGTDGLTVIVNDMTAPVVYAGPDQMVDEGTTVTFNGSGSSDNIGITDYSWTFTDGNLITLAGVQPTFNFANPGIFVVTLNVTDAAGNWGIDKMTVTVIDVRAPFTSAGPDRVVDEGTLTAFDGSGSIDNVGVVNFTWTFMDGTPVTLYGVRPTYRFNNSGVFIVMLNVTDAAGNRGADTMIVTVRDITKPIADAGPDLTVDEGTPVTFNGSGSSDNIGIINYTWTIDRGTQRIVLYGVSPSFTFSVPGLYSVSVIVSDAAGLWRNDTMILTVRDITPPVAAAGKDRTMPVGRSVTFDGSLSTDNVATTKFFWNFTYGGKAQSLEGMTVLFKFDKPGVYEVVLTVIDTAGNRGEDKVVVTVEPSVNSDRGSLAGLPWVPVLLIVMAIGAGYYVFMKRKRAHEGK